MTQSVTETLIFEPAIIKPTEEMHDVEVIVYNLCDGWHLGTIRADREGDDFYIGIYGASFNEFRPHSFYAAWAVLPDCLGLGNKFEDQQEYSWQFEQSGSDKE